jgi:cysteine-rich repeat protein
LFAISDPDNDAAESGGLGVIRPVPNGHPLHPNDTSIHNIEANASHDIYTVVPSASPGGIWALKNYPGKVNFPTQEWGQPMPTFWPTYFYPCEESMIITEIEAAVIVSPIICGNGVVDPGEQCDDGNLINGDGCSSTCKWEPDIDVNPTTWDFGNVVVGSSSTKTFAVSNTDDNGNLNIGTITITGTNFSKQNDNCSGQTIAPSGSCTVDVKFSSTAPLGIKSGTLRIPSDDPDENPLDVSLSGTAIAPNVTCSFDPVPPEPIRLIRGATLNFWAAVQNNEGTTQTFKFATKIKKPDGNLYPPSGFLLGPIDVTLDPGASKSKYLTLNIPVNTPYGTYTYYGYVGNTPPSTLYGSCQFSFTVVQ